MAMTIQATVWKIEINTVCNNNDDDFNFVLSTRYSPLQVNLREVLRLGQEVRDDEMTFQNIDNNGPTSTETIMILNYIWEPRQDFLKVRIFKVCVLTLDNDDKTVF
ncbi:uncharacterized protein EAF01_002725 [Botrytis porri]|uniref:uncharacterized protein n=1 Tax=Botrytis porri TaxID=87229 RepID=UPI0019018BC9|nr:uncharacterized protein EAF01_002725 [Botrytis porri]KAF7911217.1 hypothetical protein EAF01_002725 [Botrytis porri]